MVAVVFDVNWDARSHDDIWRQVQGRGAGFSDSGGAWNSLAGRLRDVAGSVDRATAGLEATRTGAAVGAAQGAVGPMGTWTSQARAFSDAVGAVSYEQDRALVSTRSAVPPPVARPTTAPTWAGIAALASADVDSTERTAVDAERRARAAMSRYQEFSALRATELPRFTPPGSGSPVVSVIPSGAGTGAAASGVGSSGRAPTTAPGGGPAPRGFPTTTPGGGAPGGSPTTSPGGVLSGSGTSGPGTPSSGPGGTGTAATGVGGADAGRPGGGTGGSGAGGASPGRTPAGPAGTPGTGVPSAGDGDTPGRGSTGPGSAVPGGRVTGTTAPAGTVSTGAGATVPGARSTTLPGNLPGTDSSGHGAAPTSAGSGAASTPITPITPSTPTTSGGAGVAAGRGAVDPAASARPATAGPLLEPAVATRAAAATGERGVMPFAPVGGFAGAGAAEQRLPRAAYLREDDPDAIAGELPRVVPPVIGG